MNFIDYTKAIRALEYIKLVAWALEIKKIASVYKAKAHSDRKSAMIPSLVTSHNIQLGLEMRPLHLRRRTNNRKQNCVARFTQSQVELKLLNLPKATLLGAL